MVRSSHRLKERSIKYQREANTSSVFKKELVEVSEVVVPDWFKVTAP